MENNDLKEYIERLNNEYIKKHLAEQEREELIVENNIEMCDIKGYHGREIFELLQNADDAYQKSIDSGEIPECDLEVKIEYTGNILRVSNTGTLFDKDGIKSIVEGNNSTKTGGGYIGNKGTGFRSVLNWAERVRISSGNINIEFSEKHASDVLNTIKNEPQIAKQLKKRPDLYIPMLALPEVCDEREINNGTEIEIETDPDRCKDRYGVTEQIESMDLRILLFMPNIKSICIITENKKILYTKENDTGMSESVILKKTVNSEPDTEERYYLFRKNIPCLADEEGQIKDVQLAIAVPENSDSFRNAHLYSFFPLLNTESPFNCVLHATYELDDHRDSVIRNDVNSRIMEKQLEFIIETAEKFIGKDDYTAYRIITPSNEIKEDWKFESVFEGLENKYMEMIKDAKILRTVNDEYISLNDGPKLFDNDFPDCFTGAEFKSYLKYIRNNGFTDFLKLTAEYTGKDIAVNEAELEGIVNKATLKWDISTRVKVFDWWKDHYENSLPNLLKNMNGEWLSLKERCYFLVGSLKNMDIPDWVHINFIDVDYQEELIRIAQRSEDFIQKAKDQVETHKERIISQIYKLVEFSSLDISTVIQAVNGSVKDSYEHSIDFIKWLWRNYGGKDNWEVPNKDKPIKYHFPADTENIVVEPEHCYFGRYYNSELSEKLFGENYYPFPPPEKFLVEDDDREAFERFISKFKVSRFPPVEQQKISPIESYDEEIKNYIIGNQSVDKLRSVTYNLPFINDLDSILECLSTEEVVKWIHEDHILNAYLSSEYYTENAEITYRAKWDKTDRIYERRIKNYMLVFFNEKEWVRIDGKRYSPKQVLNALNSRKNIEFADFVPVIDRDYIDAIASSLNIGKDEVEEIFGHFAFCKEVTDLSSNDFYGLLLKLPDYEFSKSSKLSSVIYRIIESSEFVKTFKGYENSENMTEFFKNGKVLVTFEKKNQYYPANKTYLPSTKIITDVPVLKKRQRSNNDIFVKIFGCKLYNYDFTIIKEKISVSKANEAFRRYYNEFKKYASAFRESNENINKYFSRLTITLAESVTVKEGDRTINVKDEYTCIRESAAKWYIIVHGEEYDINRTSEVIENIYDNISNTPGFDAGKLGELFRAKEESDRRFLIIKEFGSLDVIDDFNYAEELKNSFTKRVHEIDSDYNIKDDIDFSNFDSVENTEKVIKVLRDINSDVKDFESSEFRYHIDLIPFYKSELRDYINSKKRDYKNYLYNKAIDDKKLQDRFISDVEEFENFDLETYKDSKNFDKDSKNFDKNSIYFDVAAFVGKQEELSKQNKLNADEEYSENYMSLNPDKLFEDEISNDKAVQTMIYFNRAEDFSNWIENEKSKLNSIRSNETEYDGYKDIVPEKMSFDFSSAKNMEYNERAAERKYNGVYTHSLSKRTDRDKKIIGNKGELLVYNYLCREMGKENVFPRSEAFVEMEIIKPGLAVSGDYDISYRDDTGREYFVEVKVSDGSTFYISPGELDFAKANEDKYKLFVVYDVKSQTPKFFEMPARFWKDERFCRKEIIERIEFSFELKDE